MVVPCHFRAPPHSYKYEASDTLQREQRKRTEKEQRETGRIWRYAAHKPTKGYQHFHPSQSSHSANISTPRNLILKVLPSSQYPNRRFNLLVREGKLSKLCICITPPYLLSHSIFHPRQNSRAWVWPQVMFFVC